MRADRDDHPVSSEFLFVYGTLMRGYPHPMARELAQRAAYKGRAAYQGRLFLVESYPGAVPSANKDDVVHGEVFHLHDLSYLAAFDHYEACDPGASKPTQYRRVIQTVQMDSGETVETWIYLYNWPTSKLSRIASGKFPMPAASTPDLL